MLHHEVRGILIARGYRDGGNGVWVRYNHRTLFISEEWVDVLNVIFDAAYVDGYKDGFEKGAYEEMTKEDVS